MSAPSKDIETGHAAIAVIIPCLNEEQCIGICLDALCHLGIGISNIQIILVDNGSTDRTVETAASYLSRLPLRIFCVRDVRISAMRNYGASRTSARILAFLDADCVPHEDWLKNVEALLNQPGVGVVGSKYEVPHASSWVARVWEGSQANASRRSAAYVPGGDMILLRTTFENLGGFDETLETNEDAELCKRAKRAGLSIILCPELAVVHLGTAQTLCRFYKKQRWHGKHVLKVFLRSPFRSGNERAVLIAVYTLGFEIAILAGLAVGLLAGSWRLLWIGIVLILLPAIGLSLGRSSASRRWSDVPALVILFSTYGFARAHALLRSCW